MAVPPELARTARVDVPAEGHARLPPAAGPRGPRGAPPRGCEPWRRGMAAPPELARPARVDVLVEGYARLPHVAGTVTLVRDAGRVVVVDPGMVADRDLLLRPLRDLGVGPGEVTDAAGRQRRRHA